MKHLCIVLMASWLSVINAKAIGHVVPQHSALQLKTDNNNIEVYRDNGDGGSWLQMVLVFSRDSSDNQSTTLFEDKPCKHGLIQLESKKCYYFSVQKLSLYNAMKVCETMEATLAHPLNGIENAAIVRHLNTNFTGTQGWWMGASDEAKEGQWIWAHNKAPVIYTDWWPGEPSNKEHENCLHYWINGEWKWEDVNCNYEYPYICQQ